jgi:hypothetical protein
VIGCSVQRRLLACLRGTMKFLRLMCVAGTAGWWASSVGAQAFNVDLDATGSSSQVGGGVPASTFVGAGG